MNSDREEIFIDSDEAIRRPNEVLLKLAFNEDAALGLIMSYQDIDDETIFTGIDLTKNKMWLCKAPLVIRSAINPESLQHMAKAFEAINASRQIFPIERNIFEDQPNTISRSFSARSLNDLFRMLNNMQGFPPNKPTGDPNKNYFGQPDFNSSKKPKFDFGMDAFLEAFEAGEEDSNNKNYDDNDEDPNDSNPWLDKDDEDPDELG